MPSACQWLHITQPLWEEPAVSPLCWDCCFTHCAVPGPFHSSQQQLDGWELLVKHQVHQHCAHGTCALLDLPCPGPLSSLKPRGAGTTQVHLALRKHQALTFDQQQNTHHTHKHRHTGIQNTQAGHELGAACAKWIFVTFCYVQQRHLAAGRTYCTVIHCRAREKPFHISYAQGELFLHNPQCTRHQRINIQQFEMFSSTASPISL